MNPRPGDVIISYSHTETGASLVRPFDSPEAPGESNVNRFLQKSITIQSQPKEKRRCADKRSDSLITPSRRESTARFEDEEWVSSTDCY